MIFTKRKFGMEYRFKNDELIISAFLNDSNNNLIIAPGLPQLITRHHPIVELVRKNNINLFIPNYPGTYDSNGKLTVASATRALEQTIELVKSGSANELYSCNKSIWGTNKVFVLGFSFGALPALLQKIAVDKTILLCPFVSFDFHLDGAPYRTENINHTLDFLSRAYPNTYRFDKQEFIDELERVKHPSTKDNLIVLSKSDDASIPTEEVDFIRKRYKCDFDELPGGHSLSLDDKTLSRVVK